MKLKGEEYGAIITIFLGLIVSGLSIASGNWIVLMWVFITIIWAFLYIIK